MRLVNLDEMVLIGPGSEWFWTAISGVVLAATFIAIYRQLALQRGANQLAQMDAIDREWATEAMARNRLRVLEALQQHDLALGMRSMVALGDYFERIAVLVRTGSIGRGLAYEYVGTTAEVWWAFSKPFVERFRAEFDDPLAHTHFEWLAAEMSKIAKKRSVWTSRDQAWIDRALAGAIAGNRDAVQAFEELRAVIVRSGSTRKLSPQS